MKAKALFLTAAILAGCGIDKPADYVVDDDETVPGGTLPSTRVESGAVLYVNGTELRIEGDLIVESEAAIEGLAEDLVLIIGGDFLHHGEIRSNRHLAIVSSPDLIPVLADLDARHTDNQLDLIPGSGLFEQRDWEVSGKLFAGRNTASAPTLHLDMVGNLSLQASSNQTSLELEIPDGIDAGKANACNISGASGGAGGRFSVRVVGGMLRLHDVTFTGGNGGAGAEVEAGPCADGSGVTAGVGGAPGTFRIVAEQTSRFEVSGSVIFDGFNGGDGGDARIFGFDGAPGASVAANGGLGADVTGYTLRVTDGISYADGATLSMDIGDGGTGGVGKATGGAGLMGVCDANGVGSPSLPGGDGFVVGGRGGNVSVTVDTASGSVGGSFTGGTGGRALSYGGRGGEGVDCARIGGDGGNGVKGTSNGGQAGTSTAGSNGSSGASDAFGGRGGNGGFGEDMGGRGGDGGEAIGATSKGGDAGDGGDSQGQGGDGGNGGCIGGAGGLGGAGFFPGAPGLSC